MEEVLSVQMERRGLTGVIALKGLPSTCKTELALRIGSWAKCPVLCIQDFLGGGGGGADYYSGVDAADFTPPTTTDQVHRHHRNAFTALLNVAHRHLSNAVSNCVVIKSSSPNTPSELLQLLQLGAKFVDFRVIIIECKIKNNYLWKLRFDMFSDRYTESKSWSRPRSWKDIHKIMDDDDDDHPPSSDLNHLHELLRGMHRDTRYVAWLGADPFYDLFLAYDYSSTNPLSDEFNDAIKYLLTAPKQELPAQNSYVADYDELRRFLFDKKLRDAARKGRSQSFCEGDCVFRYLHRVPEEYEADFCAACHGQISKKPAYSCYFCVTTLHKTCAERLPISALHKTCADYIMYFYDHQSDPHPCKACRGGGREFSEECRSCLSQDRLKCHLLPTILNHNSHPHFLSIQLHNTDFRCKACGETFRCEAYKSFREVETYGCKRCAFYCHLSCAFLPLKLKHRHGGHEHVMKLMYNRDAMEEEEDPWCDCCYEDMDPELWFYYCQECPHYVVHLLCSGGYDVSVDDPKMAKFVEQLQSQLDDSCTAGNSMEPC